MTLPATLGLSVSFRSLAGGAVGSPNLAGDRVSRTTQVTLTAQVIAANVDLDMNSSRIVRLWSTYMAIPAA